MFIYEKPNQFRIQSLKHTGTQKQEVMHCTTSVLIIFCETFLFFCFHFRCVMKIDYGWLNEKRAAQLIVVVSSSSFLMCTKKKIRDIVSFLQSQDIYSLFLFSSAVRMRCCVPCSHCWSNIGICIYDLTEMLVQKKKSITYKI